MQQDNIIYRLPKTQEVTGLSRSTIYALEAQGLFPSRIKLGARSVGWLKNDLENWITSRARASRSNVQNEAA